MEDGIEYVLLSILGTIIVLLAITFAIREYDEGLDYNRVLVQDMQQRASSRYSLEYNQPVLYMTPTDAYYDILAVDPFVDVQIDGSLLDINVLEKARNGEAYATQLLETALNKTKYHRVTAYDPSGNITYINFIGD